MKIFSGGIETETNTFSPMPTGLAHFDVVRHADVAQHAELLDDLVPFNVWRKVCEAINAENYFGLYAVAEPSGVTTKDAYESLRDEFLEDLGRQLPVDGVLLCLHGAMVADGYADCEGDLTERVRALVGPNVVVAVELDLHCHLTQSMVAAADLIITLKEYPHIDVEARGLELFELMHKTIIGEYLPTMGLFDCRMVGLYPTTSKELRDFIQCMQSVEQQDKVLSVSFVHGFPFGDVKEAGGKLLVITNGDESLANHLADTLGKSIFEQRKSIAFDALPLPDALSKAVTMSQASSTQVKKPVVVADQSDNPGGGAPADATYALSWLLEHQISNVALAIFYDPEVVKLARAVGVGATLNVRLGGKMGVNSGNPLDLVVSVTALKENYRHQFPQSQGQPNLFMAGDTVALYCQGIDIIVSSERTQCFCPSIFDDLGIPAKHRDILVVKSSQHFYGAFAPIASQVIYMAAPGTLSTEVKSLNYNQMSTQDKYPWIDNPFQKDELNEG